MSITNIIKCAGQTPALKKPNCGFVPQRISKMIGWKKGIKFDPATDNFNDAKFSELVQKNQMWSVETPVSTDNTPDTTYESIEGVDKQTSIGIVDLDFTFRCLTTCEMKEFRKINSTWNVAFEMENSECETKLFAAINEDGTITGFDTNLVNVKSLKFGTASTAAALIMRVQFSRKGTKQFATKCDIFDVEVDLCDYNIGNVQVQEVNPVSVVSNVVTIEHRFVDDCDGNTPIEGVGTGAISYYLVPSNGSANIAPDSITPNTSDPSIVTAVYDLNGTTVLGTNPFTTQLWDTALNTPVVKINDCFYKGESGGFSI